MKATLVKAGITAGIATATTAFLGIMPAQAVSFGTTCDFSGAVVCTQVLSGNDSAGDLNSILGEPTPFDKILWEFLAKINAEVKDGPGPTANIIIDFNTTPDEGDENAFFITYDTVSGKQTKKSGTWAAIESYIGNTPFVLAMKAGDKYAYNYLDGTVFSGTWNTERFKVGGGPDGGNQPEMSHITMYVPDDFVPVPTPALLPGLIGMGVAALRKRKGEAEESTEA